MHLYAYNMTIASRTRPEVGRGRRNKISRASLSAASVLGSLVLSWTNSSRSSSWTCHGQISAPSAITCLLSKKFPLVVNCHPEKFCMCLKECQRESTLLSVAAPVSLINIIICDRKKNERIHRRTLPHGKNFFLWWPKIFTLRTKILATT
jgi:hypothetical protein